MPIVFSSVQPQLTPTQVKYPMCVVVWCFDNTPHFGIECSTFYVQFQALETKPIVKKLLYSHGVPILSKIALN